MLYTPRIQQGSHTYIPDNSETIANKHRPKNRKPNRYHVQTYENHENLSKQGYTPSKHTKNRKTEKTGYLVAPDHEMLDMHFFVLDVRFDGGDQHFGHSVVHGRHLRLPECGGTKGCVFRGR